ncbi:hypothetical protein V8B97DRAFT_2023592 [Scleroderma yunnanense]
MHHQNIPVNPLSYSLIGAVGDTYTNPQNHSCSFWRLCRHPDSHGGHCAMIISCNTVAAHFRDNHNIVDMSRKDYIVCQWPGCLKQVLRHNFVRHVRERHLCHQRL